MSIRRLLDEEFSRILSKNQRVHLSETPITTIYDAQQSATPRQKPRGLWYGFGPSWIDWNRHDSIYNGESLIVYVIDLDPSNLIVLQTQAHVDDLVSKYGAGNDQDEYCKINWNKVAEDFAGIEIPTYDAIDRHERPARQTAIRQDDLRILLEVLLVVSLGHQQRLCLEGKRRQIDFRGREHLFVD